MNRRLKKTSNEKSVRLSDWKTDAELFFYPNTPPRLKKKEAKKIESAEARVVHTTN